MTLLGWVQILLFFGLILAATKPLGIYMHRVFEGESQPLRRVLGPVERAVFVLREALGFDYNEIAQMVERDPAACRQIMHRARARVASGGVRFDVDDADAARLTDEFLEALRDGDVEGVLRVLAPDVLFTADGGGKAPAIQHPMSGDVAVVCTSWGPISWVAASLLGGGVDMWMGLNPVMTNASVSKVVIGRTGTTLVSLNDHGHLEPDNVTYR